MTRLGRDVTVKECVGCGATFVPTVAFQKYHSNACKQLGPASRPNRGTGKGWARGRQFAPRRYCERCGATFHAPPSLVARGGGRFCSNQCRTADIAEHPDRWPQTQTRRGSGGRRADLGDQYFRSSWEANYARYLNWLIAHGSIVSWEFEPTTFAFPIKRGTRFYTPDFLVVERPGESVYHEVKGYMDQRSRTKLDRMARYYPEVTIVLIDRAAYYSVADAVAALIPEWETVKGRAHGLDR